jgi:copper homeostasis protein (lipoprotein)
MRSRIFAAILAGAAAVATSAPAEEGGQHVGAHGLALPASFAGVLPCADCPGIRHQLDLAAGGGFVLHRDYIDRGPAPVALGRWHADPARRAIVLRAEDGEEILWEVKGADRLRLLDGEGNPIDSDLDYDLAGGAYAPADLTATLTGSFVYFADAAVFTDCLTGDRMPVVMAGDYLALERAYLDARPAPMAPLLVRLDARLALAEAMEGPPRRSVHVEAVHHVTPHGACQTARAPAALENGFWAVRTVDGVPLPEGAGMREAYLLLFADGAPRFSATLGCNMMMGGYTLEDAALGFGAAASTMMACPPPLDRLEGSFAAALAATRGYASDGHTLHLLDEAGRITASFEAVHTPWH